MTHPKKLTTTVSIRGQVILPVAIRRQKGWAAGTRLAVEDTTDGVLLRPLQRFPATKPADVFGMLHAPNRPKSLDEMEAGILRKQSGAMLAIETNVLVRYLTRPKTSIERLRALRAAS